MIDYNVNGLRLSYPKSLKKKSELNFLVLTNRRNKDSLFIIVQSDEEITFEYLYRLNIDPNANRYKTSGLEIIRAGDYQLFPGAKEILTKRPNYGASGFSYFWDILIPAGNYSVEITLAASNDDEINDFWKPIIESIELDPSQFVNRLKTALPSIKSYNWTKTSILKPSKHFKHTFWTEYNILEFYDSAIEFRPEEDFDDDVCRQRIIKRDKTVTLCSSDVLDIIVDFYLNADLPDENKKPIPEHIIEGLITIDSGKLYVNKDTVPGVEINMKKGNYKFRVYFAAANFKNNSQRFRIYFWETEEKETNEIKIIKQGPEPS